MLSLSFRVKLILKIFLFNYSGTFVESTIKNIDRSTQNLLEVQREKSRFVKSIFEFNISYELFNCGQTLSYSDGEVKSINNNANKKLGYFGKEGSEEENDESHIFLSETCLDKVYLNYNLKMDENIESENNITIKDFEFLKLISKGAYGRVWLVKRIKTCDIYAMKIVNFAEKVKRVFLTSKNSLNFCSRCLKIT